MIHAIATVGSRESWRGENSIFDSTVPKTYEFGCFRGAGNVDREPFRNV